MRFDRHGQGHDHMRHFGMKMMARGFGSGFGGGWGHGGGHGGGWGEGWDSDEPPFGGRRGGRGGSHRGRMFGPGELRLLLLLLLDEQDRHGYELIKAIEELAGGDYAPSPGVVYPTLALLVDEGMITEVPGEGARKAFTMTDVGRAELAAKLSEAEAVVKRLGDVAKARTEAESRAGSHPLRRAVANLMLALRHKVGSGQGGGIEPETAHQIADILDEAARKIERLGGAQ
ncbi:MAG: PadR family transcriptional regulator [Novosphingobium sp.]